MGDLIYLYGFVGSSPKTWSLPGLLTIRHADILSVARRVPAEEFEASALTERLKDEAWLKAQVLDHQKTLETIMKERTVVPLKWGVLFRTENGVRKMLQERYQPIRALLEKLKGREEWTVRVTVDRQSLQDSCVAQDPDVQGLQKTIQTESAGAAYLLTEQLKLLKGTRADEWIGRFIQDFLQRLLIHAEDSRSTSSVRPPGARENGELIFENAFLVSKENRPAFSQEVLVMAKRWGVWGFKIHQVGPFPPYYFSNSEPKEFLGHD